MTAPTLNRELFLVQRFLFFLLCCSPLFLFKEEQWLLKVLFYFTFVIFFCLCIFQKQNPFCYKRLIKILSPWIPLFISVLILMGVHGKSGFSPLFHAAAIFFLASVCINGHIIERKWAYVFLGSLVGLIYILILGDISINGLDAEILGVNKNRLMPELTMVSSSLTVAWILDRKSLGIKIGSLVLFSFILNVITVAFTEVRTAFLVYLTLLPLLFIFDRAKFRKVLPWLLISILLILTAFVLTGRLQEGFYDLEKYYQGEPNSSWGIRLELWKLAFQGFLIKPLSGWGNYAFDMMIEFGLPYAVPSFHAKSFHNDIFNLLATGGLVALTGTFATIFLLIKKSLIDFPTITFLVSSIVIGIPGLCWSSNSTSIYLLMLVWLIFFVTSESYQKELLLHNQQNTLL